MEKLNFNKNIENTLETQSNKEKVLEKIKELLSSFLKNKSLDDYYKSIFWWDFNENNPKQILEIFSHAYIKKYWLNLSSYLQNINQPIDFSSRKEMYKQIDDTQNYAGTLKQNIDLFNFLVNQVELKKIMWELVVKADTDTQLWELEKNIENWDKKPSSQTNLPEINSPEKEDQDVLLLNPKKIKSSPYKVSPRWTTMCSYTARRNLQNLWVSNYLQWNAISLTKWLEKSWSPSFWDYIWLKNHLESKISEWNTFDIYPKTKNWHRAICFAWKNENWENDFFVLDPYYTSKSTKPILLEEYISKNTWNFWEIVVNNDIYNVENEKFA